MKENINQSNNLHKDAIRIFTEYVKLYKDDELSGLLNEIKENPNILHRTYLEGHITASGMVVKDGKVLLIWHNFLQKYLQPGGHVDPPDKSIIAAAQREVEEETGLKVKMHSLFGDMPINIAVQDLPDRPEKNEPAHKHYDCMFVFEPITDEIILQKEEVDEFQWLPIEGDFQNGTLRESVERFRKNIRLL